MFGFRITVEKALEADAELSAALSNKSLSTPARTKEVESYRHGKLFIAMMVDALHKSDEMSAIEIQLIHICRLFKKRAPAGENCDIEFTQLLTVMQKIYKSYLLTAQSCRVMLGDVAVDRKLGVLAQILELLMPLTKERLSAAMTHADMLILHYESYRQWEYLFDSLPRLTAQKECAFVNFLETYSTLCDAFIILDKHKSQLLDKHHYFAAIWVLEKCGVMSLCKDNPLVTTSRLALSEKIARLLMCNDEMCRLICEYAKAANQSNDKLSDTDIDKMHQDLTGMIFSSIPQLKDCVAKAFASYVFDNGSALVNSLRESQKRGMTKYC